MNKLSFLFSLPALFVSCGNHSQPVQHVQSSLSSIENREDGNYLLATPSDKPVFTGFEAILNDKLPPMVTSLLDEINDTAIYWNVSEFSSNGKLIGKVTKYPISNGALKDALRPIPVNLTVARRLGVITGGATGAIAGFSTAAVGVVMLFSNLVNEYSNDRYNTTNVINIENVGAIRTALIGSGSTILSRGFALTGLVIGGASAMYIASKIALDLEGEPETSITKTYSYNEPQHRVHSISSQDKDTKLKFTPKKYGFIKRRIVEKSKYPQNF